MEIILHQTTLNMLTIFCNQMHKHYKHNEISVKNLIYNNISSTDSHNKIKLIIYYPKFNTTSLIISNNFSHSTSHLNTTSVVYKFKCPLGECFSTKNNSYIDLTMILSRHLTSLKLVPSLNTLRYIYITPQKNSNGKCLPTTQRKKQTKLQILQALYIKINKPFLNNSKTWTDH